MDHETKVTYSVIAVLIIILGGLAFFLQPAGVQERAEQTKESIDLKKVTETPTKATSPTTMEPQTFSSATITTNKGTIEIAFTDNAPGTVQNFTKLASSKFYDGVRFHRVIKGFMIQTGDPLSKDKANEATWGNGGPGYTIKDELSGNEQYPLGTVAMARTTAPNSGGSQFFIVTANPGAPLPPSYTVFGKVTKGMETALAIENVKTAGSPTDRPLEDVIIEKVEVR